MWCTWGGVWHQVHSLFHQSKPESRIKRRGFPLLSEVFHLALIPLYYFIASQFHSLQFLTKKSHVRPCVCRLCEILSEQICRWVIDRVDALNIAGVGLHFLHILRLKNKTKQRGVMHKTRLKHRTIICSYSEFTHRCRFRWWAVGLLALPVRGVDRQSSSVSQHKSLQGVILVNHFHSYLNIISFFCAKNTTAAKNTSPATAETHSQVTLPAVREWRFYHNQLVFNIAHPVYKQKFELVFLCAIHSESLTFCEFWF